MTVTQASTSEQARFERIEYAHIRAIGLLAHFQAGQVIPLGWQSQVEEVLDLLEKSTLDVMDLRKEGERQQSHDTECAPQVLESTLSV